MQERRHWTSGACCGATEKGLISSDLPPSRFTHHRHQGPRPWITGTCLERAPYVSFLSYDSKSMEAWAVVSLCS